MTDDLDADARRWVRFFEVFEAVPRGGPGGPESTRRALAMMADLPAQPRVLDLGCGPGRGSADLAGLTGGRVTALDLHAPFVVQQAGAARRLGLAHRFDPVCADMSAAPFAPAAFDLVWSEGALYSIGFRAGLEVCLHLAKPGAYLGVSEAVWTVPHPPDEICRWWTAAYADIASIAEKADIVTDAGVELVGHFTLARSAWWDRYYAPIRERLHEFRSAWASDGPGLDVLTEFDTEIEMYERWGHTYSYEFFIGRRPGCGSRRRCSRSRRRWSSAGRCSPTPFSPAGPEESPSRLRAAGRSRLQASGSSGRRTAGSAATWPGRRSWDSSPA